MRSYCINVLPHNRGNSGNSTQANVKFLSGVEPGQGVKSMYISMEPYSKHDCAAQYRA